MEVFKSETLEVIKRYRSRRLTFPECIAALDAAVAGFMPRLTSDEIPPLRALMAANYETVMKERARRRQR